MPQITITDLDMRALQISEQRPDQNIYEFDLTLWALMASLARSFPEKVRAQFSLPEAAINALSTATEANLSRLASGVLISFQLKTNSQIILDKLQEKYVPIISLSQVQGAEFDTAYWLLLKQIAQRDHYIAAAAFGLCSGLTHAISKATDNQLRHLASITSTVFTLRFSPKILAPLLTTEQGPVKARYFYTKYQQSITYSEKIGGQK